MVYRPLFKILIFTLLLGLSLSSSAADLSHRCADALKNLVHKYQTKNQPGIYREVSFEVPGKITVTRILPTPLMEPRLKELLDFAQENKIVVMRGDASPLANQNTMYIGLSDDAMASPAAMVASLERSMHNLFGVPVNTTHLPADAQKMVEQMTLKYKTKFVKENSDQGLSYINKNKIAVNAHPGQLRVNSVVFHEITHNTLDRKILEAFNPEKMIQPSVGTRVTQKLTTTMAGREMKISGKNGPLSLPWPINEYKSYRSDEIEASIREFAQMRKDGLDTDLVKMEIRRFIEVQQGQIEALLKVPGELKISVGEAVPELLAGRKQRRIVSALGSEVNVELLVPLNLTWSEERAFIEATLSQRLKSIQSFARHLTK
jgi:hypothetical protein